MQIQASEYVQLDYTSKTAFLCRKPTIQIHSPRKEAQLLPRYEVFLKEINK